MSRALDQDLLRAHARADGKALVGLYHQAANEANSADAAGFYLTHAYVFALECGDARASDLRRKLVEMGRETLA